MDDNERSQHLSNSPYKGRYGTKVDRESAYEILKKRAEENKLAEEQAKADKEREKADRKSSRSTSRKSSRQTPTEAFVKSAARSIGSQLGRRIICDILGSILK